jgi:hypothetical protein
MLETCLHRDQVLVWVQECQRETPQGVGYVLSATASEPTIMSLCFAILIAELYDALPGDGHEAWQNVVMSVQDPTTGLFVDPLFSRDDLEPTSPGENYLLYQTTYFALNALDALECRPRYPLRFVEPFCDTAYLDKWLEGLDCSDPWKESNRVMFIAADLYAVWQWESNQSALSALHRLLDWLDAHQDPETGFWGMQEGASLLNAMAGAYHFLPFYFCLDRPFHFPEAMIKSTLSLQQSDGLFHLDGGGDTCLDVDAVDILVKCSLVTPHLADKVEAALERAYYGLLSNHAADGGFCRARHRPLPPKSWKRHLAEPLGLDRLLGRPYSSPRGIQYYSGWKKMPYDIRQSDLWSTWFRPFGLAVISARYPQAFPTDVHWGFRRTPALGWHDTARIIKCCADKHWGESTELQRLSVSPQYLGVRAGLAPAQAGNRKGLPLFEKIRLSALGCVDQ